MDLPAGQVDIWRTSLDIDAALIESLTPVLSPDERARAERFAFESHRRRFIAARGWLRQILSSYCGLPPDAIRFQYGAHGKPRLERPQALRLFFNLSHSEAIAICGVTGIAEIGVDIEFVRPLSEDKIAERFFSASEVKALSSLPADEQAEGFFRCWTRKEAYIKARGEGLSIALDSFDVSLAADSSPVLLRTGDDPDQARRWTIKDLAVPEAYRAAVAVKATGVTLQYREILSSEAF